MKFGVSTSQPLRPGDDSQSRGAAAASARAPSGVKLVNQTWGPSFVYQWGELSILTSHQLYVNLAKQIWQIDIEWIQMATFDKKKGDVDLKSTSTRFGWPWFWFWTIHWMFLAKMLRHPISSTQEWYLLCRNGTPLDSNAKKHHIRPLYWKKMAWHEKTSFLSWHNNRGLWQMGPSTFNKASRLQVW